MYRQSPIKMEEIKFSTKAAKAGAYRYVVNEEQQVCAVVVDTLPEGDFIVPEKVVIKKKEYVVVGVVGKSANKKITSCTLPPTIKYLLNNSFRNCANLTEINLHENIEIIEAMSFQGTGIKEITIPAKVESLEFLCFADCPNLTTVDASHVKKINQEVFARCPSLKSIIINTTDIHFSAFAEDGEVVKSNQSAIDEKEKADEKERCAKILEDVKHYRFYFEYDYLGDNGEKLHEPGLCLWLNDKNELEFANATPDETLDHSEVTGDVFTGESFAQCKDSIDYAIILGKSVIGSNCVSDIKLIIMKDGVWNHDEVVILSKYFYFKQTLCNFKIK